MARPDRTKRAMSLAPAAVVSPAASVNTTTLAMARRCDVSKASIVRGMSATSATLQRPLG